jgi:hypothetical protein
MVPAVLAVSLAILGGACSESTEDRRPAADFSWDPSDLIPEAGEFVAPPGSGDTWIAGIVVDEADRPIEGATVDMHAIPRTDYPVGYRLHATTSTGADGRFHVGPGPTPWDTEGFLSAWAPGYARTALRSARVVATGEPSADPGASAHLRLRRGHIVRGTLRGEDGRGPLGEVVMIAAGPPCYFECFRVGEGGEFEFVAPTGRVSVTALEGFHPRASGSLTVTPEGPNRLEIPLLRGRDIPGVVVDRQTGAPVEGAVVRAYYGRARLYRTDPEGRFVLPNHWFSAFQVWAPGYAVKTHLLAADSGTSPVGDEVVRLDRGCIGRGRVLDLDGKPLAGIRTRILLRTPDGLFEGTAGPLSRADGSFDFVGLPLPEKDGPVRVLASAHGFAMAGSAPVQAEAGGIAEGVEIRLARLSEMEGRVEDEHGNSAEGTLALQWDLPPELAEYRDAIPSGYAIRTRPDGTWRVRVPERTRVRIEASGEAFGRGTWEGDSPAREPGASGADASGSGNVIIKVLRGEPIRGVALDSGGHPVAKGSVRVEPSPMTDERPSKDIPLRSDGSFEGWGFPPGPYDLSVLSHPEFLQEVVRGVRPGGNPIRVTLRRPGGLRLLVAFPEGAERSPVSVKARALEDPTPLPPVHVAVMEPRDLLLEMQPLAPVPHAVEIRAGDWRADFARVAVGQGEPTDLGTVELERAASVAGTIRCGGKPAPAAEVEVLLVRPDGRFESAGRTRSDIEGRYRVSGLVSGEYVLSAHPLDGPLVQARLRVLRAEETPLDVEVPAGARLRVLVRDAAGNPVPGARVHLSRGDEGVVFRREDSQSLGPHSTGEAGVLLCRGLPAGEVRVTVEGPGGTSVVETVTVRAGEVASVEVALK